MRQLLLDLLPEAPPSLDNFVVGGNGEAVTGLAAWLAPDNHETSLLFWGEAASGKTHLLRACGMPYCDAAADPDLTAVAPLEDDDSDCLAVDHIEALSLGGQIALFNLFNRRRAAGKHLLTAASQPPIGLRLREDLRTRLGSGLIYRLQPLTDDEKIAALSAQALARGMRLPKEAFTYLLARAPRDMRSLSALLAALDRFSLEHQRPITLPLLREVLHAAPETERC
ncbi:DnaA regulatory inactivator Hda [Propionivibrio dicarboxylicus]|uniref:Regulatory inactivation of DnaA Hda protein n=1 Tax=Propionivibrio dicarboxylicus TaxID=83767 RepID=A0A1G8M8I9_9RHOO|nr:DnaA regulatory inactivator Hda [Propionivibrio dicarboxylicus]SDI64195.1 regulatory inactivation of DnaA Hda protein [Propionivibrio dicarboxylicus]